MFLLIISVCFMIRLGKNGRGRMPEEANLIARRAFWIEVYRTQMPGQGNTFLDAME